MPVRQRPSEKGRLAELVLHTRVDGDSSDGKLLLKDDLLNSRRQYHKRSLQSLKQALAAHYRSLQGLEIAVTELEEAIGGQQGRERPQQDEQEAEPREGTSLDLLSIDDVSQELRMSRNWVYGRIKSGEIPSVKLGRNIKVRREDLEAYLEGQRYRQVITGPH